MDCIIQKLITKTYPTLKETIFNQLWKTVKGKSIDHLYYPIALKKQFEAYQNQELLWLWNEIYDFEGYRLRKNEGYLEIKTRTKTIYIEIDCLSLNVKNMLHRGDFNLFVELSKYVSKEYKPKSFKTVHWIIQEENYFDLLCNEPFPDSDDENPFQIYLISIQNPYSFLKLD